MINICDAKGIHNLNSYVSNFLDWIKNFVPARSVKLKAMLLDLTVVSFKYLESFKLVSSAFALLFTEISVVRGTEISVKSSAKADETIS